MINDPPLAISITEFCRISSLGRTKTYELIRHGLLRATRVGRRTLIDMESAVALVNGYRRWENSREPLPSVVSPVHPVDSPDAYLSHVECTPRRLLRDFSDGKFSTQTGEV